MADSRSCRISPGSRLVLSGFVLFPCACCAIKIRNNAAAEPCSNPRLPGAPLQREVQAVRVIGENALHRKKLAAVGRAFRCESRAGQPPRHPAFFLRPVTLLWGICALGKMSWGPPGTCAGYACTCRRRLPSGQQFPAAGEFRRAHFQTPAGQPFCRACFGLRGQSPRILLAHDFFLAPVERNDFLAGRRILCGFLYPDLPRKFWEPQRQPRSLPDCVPGGPVDRAERDL